MDATNRKELFWRVTHLSTPALSISSVSVNCPGLPLVLRIPSRVPDSHRGLFSTAIVIIQRARRLLS